MTHLFCEIKTVMEKIKVIELFAGVGGFRLGLEGWQGKSSLSGYTKGKSSNFKIVWSNQWEPATKVQHASDIYVNRFGEECHSNKDIATVTAKEIPDFDMLVGGFPCQDYSVAKQLRQSHGISGKKGVLWWEIHRIIEEKKNKPNYILLENVDRLLKSPVSQRGRDLAIILASLSDLGYVVEWRVINAAEYGLPQKRRRTFIFGYHKNSPIFSKIKKPIDWISKDGVIATGFKIKEPDKNEFVFPFNIEGSLVDITNYFNKKGLGNSPFQNAGIMIDRKVWSIETKPDYEGKRVVLKDILEESKDVPEEYFLDENDLEKWKYLKGSKKEPRKKSNGEVFYYIEGALPFPDPIDKPARTIITSEGGKTASRFKHIVNQDGILRRLTPMELERANMFPDNHTKEAKDTKRASFMGNALVVGIVEKMATALTEILKQSDAKEY
jgi:DNA (cytosine-5)-methyltransferase 1